jgi:hypothetical protein
MKDVRAISTFARLAASGSQYLDVAAMPWQEPFPQNTGQSPLQGQGSARSDNVIRNPARDGHP